MPNGSPEGWIFLFHSHTKTDSIKFRVGSLGRLPEVPEYVSLVCVAWGGLG